MARLGPILVATDRSAHARHAAARAAHLAHETRSAVTPMHMLPGKPMAQSRAWLGASMAPERKSRDAAQRQLRQLAADLASARRVEVAFEDAAGSAPDEIVRAADRVDAQPLVTGARGAGHLRRRVLGTTSARLMRCTDRPLLVLRQSPPEPCRRVRVAVDFSPWSRRALTLAWRVAPAARFVVRTVSHVPFEEKLRFAGVEQAQSTAAELLLGSVTRSVLAEGQVDVLLSTWRPACEPCAWK